MRSKVCPVCESTEFVGGIETSAVNPGGLTGALNFDGFVGGTVGQLCVKSPRVGGWSIAGKVIRQLLAQVCGNCGHVELYVEDPKPLVQAAKGAKT